MLLTRDDWDELSRGVDWEMDHVDRATAFPFGVFGMLDETRHNQLDLRISHDPRAVDHGVDAGDLSVAWTAGCGGVR
jgi:hypothetical protein